MMWRALALVFCVGLGAAPLAAQENPRLRVEVERGARIRLTTAEERVAGEFVLREEDGTLVLRRRGAELRVPVAEVRMIEGRGGRDRRRGAAWGGAILAGITTTGAAVDYAQGVVGAGDVIGAFFGGAVLGAGIGALLAPVGWERIPIASGARITGAR